MKSAALLFCTALASLAAHAHEGHHMPDGAHWHATDLFGYVVLAVAVGAAAWWIRRK